MEMKEALIKEAKQLGFPLCGVAAPRAFLDYPAVKKPYSSDGQTWPQPLELAPWCQSVIVVGLASEDKFLDTVVFNKNIRAQFYDEMIQHRLFRLRDWVCGQGQKAIVTDKLAFKRAAVLAGIGLMGKNTLIANPEYGSNLRLGVLLTDMQLSADTPLDPFTPELCGDCRRCLDICPAGALVDYKLDFGKCLVPALDFPGREDDRDLARQVQPLLDECSYVECNLCQKVCPL
ncbi:MAG: epoxyqueuosine reductase [Firmicutes bacterium]|nr:epoxyqueuosine reductase [Bacillota bacterium]